MTQLDWTNFECDLVLPFNEDVSASMRAYVTQWQMTTQHDYITEIHEGGLPYRIPGRARTSGSIQFEVMREFNLNLDGEKLKPISKKKVEECSIRELLYAIRKKNKERGVLI